MESSQNRQRSLEPIPDALPRPTDIWSFTSLMADALRLPDETLAMAFAYINRFTKYSRSGETETAPAVDAHTLSLAALSLASKSTEAPRRLREFLLPAYRLLHSSTPSSKPLSFPSTHYDNLRATLVQAELILLRILKFELRVQLPLDFIARYLNRAIGDINMGGGAWNGTEDYDEFGIGLKKELKVVEFMDTAIGKACSARGVEACKSYQLSNLFPARTVAAACVYLTLKDRGLDVGQQTEVWLDEVTSGKVDMEDFQEATTFLKRPVIE